MQYLSAHEGGRGGGGAPAEALARAAAAVAVSLASLTACLMTVSRKAPIGVFTERGRRFWKGFARGVWGRSFFQVNVSNHLFCERKKEREKDVQRGGGKKERKRGRTKKKKKKTHGCLRARR